MVKCGSKDIEKHLKYLFKNNSVSCEILSAVKVSYLLQTGMR